MSSENLGHIPFELVATEFVDGKIERTTPNALVSGGLGRRVLDKVLRREPARVNGTRASQEGGSLRKLIRRRLPGPRR